MENTFNRASEEHEEIKNDAWLRMHDAGLKIKN
jgi:hypothetical protein